MACNKKKKMANGGKVSEKKKPQLKCGGKVKKKKMAEGGKVSEKKKPQMKCGGKVKKKK